jgi:hypothetical protein
VTTWAVTRESRELALFAGDTLFELLGQFEARVGECVDQTWS